MDPKVDQEANGGTGAARPRSAEDARRLRRVGPTQRAPPARRAGARQLRGAVRGPAPGRERGVHGRPRDPRRTAARSRRAPTGRRDDDGPRRSSSTSTAAAGCSARDESHDTICRSLANASGAVVLNVGYRCAPEASSRPPPTTRWPPRAGRTRTPPSSAPTPAAWRSRATPRAATSRRSSPRTCATRAARRCASSCSSTRSRRPTSTPASTWPTRATSCTATRSSGTTSTTSRRPTKDRDSARLAAQRRRARPAAGADPVGRVRPAAPAGRAVPRPPAGGRRARRLPHATTGMIHGYFGLESVFPSPPTRCADAGGALRAALA